MAQEEVNVLCGWSEMPQRIPTKRWLSENQPQKASRCRPRMLNSRAFGGQENLPQRLQTIITGGSAGTQLIRAGLQCWGSSQDLEKSGAAGEGLCGVPPDRLAPCGW